MKLFEDSDLVFEMRMRVVSPITEDWTVARIVRERVPYSWEGVFADAQPELETISGLLEHEKTKYRLAPLMKDVFRAFEMTPLSSIKVVILGQDPYPQILSSGWPRAVGMSFSVRRDDDIPSSLKNIYQELHGNIPTFRIPSHGDLTAWALQGVFLLNVGLTVRAHEPESHVDLWRGFTHKVVRAITEQREQALFVLWGQKAQSIQRVLGETAPKLLAAHPSGKSATRGFFGCRHFEKIQQHLEKTGQKSIDWKL